MRLITSKEIVGQIARHAVQQHPFNAPEGLFELVQDVLGKSRADFPDGVPELPMRWFKDSSEIEIWLRDGFTGHQTLEAWNTPKSRHGAQIVFSSRYGGPAPEDDFIDIDALWRNVSRATWSDAEEVSANPDEAVQVCDRCDAQIYDPCQTDGAQAGCELPDHSFPNGRR